MQPLPPLECLRFFEAAARRESFAKAAEELHVTSSAVAHRIKDGRPGGPVDLHDWPLLYDLGWDADWPYWFARQGQPSPDLSRASGFRLYSMVVDAALEGMGTAIGRSAVIAREMERGAHQRLGVDVMSRHLVCSALVVATLTLAVCSSACVQTQNEHRPAAQALADLRASAEAGDAEAVAWYRRAAEQGHTRAQYNLGGMYGQGLGVPPDAVEAHMWLTIAASRSTGAERELIVTASRRRRRADDADRLARGGTPRAGVARGAPGHEEPCRAAERHGTRELDYRSRF